ncbi:endo alpha-1,4 polygalactosaminidase [Granulicoccus phenolivorans]|uniref:endo alpha-1,4 polygalactosaminidase n=1 Tax=Granulicoccus phenolivorans TaxID=266854 RepID=UPI0004271207|nr:endo alpha-1,4 polygalactosaminidase [Granulicoccus phenolivorans]
MNERGADRARPGALAAGLLAGLLLLTGCSTSADTSTEETPTTSVRPATPGSWWVPERGASFQIQYAGQPDLTLPVAVYNLDWESTTTEQTAQLKARGVKLVCYINAGASENWRSDKQKFPREVIGKSMKGWEGENWLDVNRTDVLVPIMAARMQVCADKGFDAVDPDNTDGWNQKTGFTITPQAQIAYQTALAQEAHNRGMAIGLKNDAKQLADLSHVVDFAVNEQCIEYQECDPYVPFLASGRAVFNIEYTGDPATVCARRPAGMSTVIKDLSLDGPLQSC